MITAVVSLVSAHLAAGGLAITALLALRKPLPESFLRFCSIAVALAAVVAALSSTGESAGPRILLAAAALGWYVWLRARGASVTPALIALVAGLAALVAECGSLPEHLLCMTGAVSSGLLMGAVSVSMVLGHWYLVDTSLSIAALKQGALAYCATVAFRSTHVAFALVGGGWEALRLSRAEDIFFSPLGFFFLIRILIGLVAPALLAVLIWKTVQMRSTQSATGLLYIALTLVLFGELISQFLTLATGFPL